MMTMMMMMMIMIPNYQRSCFLWTLHNVSVWLCVQLTGTWSLINHTYFNSV